MRSFFLVGAKLVGIYYLISVCSVLPLVFSSLVTSITDHGGNVMETAGELAFSAIHYSLLDRKSVV